MAVAGLLDDPDEAKDEDGFSTISPSSHRPWLVKTTAPMRPIAVPRASA